MRSTLSGAQRASGSEFAAERLDPTSRDDLAFEAANLGPQETGEPDIALAQAERANVDVALEWAATAGETPPALSLVFLLELYWATNDPVGGRERIDRLLAAAGDDIEPRALANALRVHGASYDMTERTDLATQEYERAIEIFRSLGDEAEAAHIMHRIASGALHQGDVERAIRIATHALELDRRHGRRRDEAMALNVLSRAAFEQDNLEEGLRLAHESAAVAEAADFTWWHGVTLVQAAEYLIAAGDPTAAIEPLSAGLESLAAVDDRINLPIALAASAALAAQHEDATQAGLLWGAAEAAAETEPRPTTNQALSDYEPHLEPVRGGAFDEARQRGRTLTIKEATDHTLTNLKQ
jgi:tetratricopeptide (TPR) repeat protein